MGSVPTVLAAGDSDELPTTVLVCLGTADCDEDAGGLADNVGEVEGGQFPWTQRRRVAEQDDSPLSGTDRGEWIHGRHQPVELGDGERVSLTAGCGAHDAAKSAADASYDDVGGRVEQAFFVVPVRDGGAVAVEGPRSRGQLRRAR